MLTRLRVRGFKNLLDVDVRFGPFTCIVGANGVGKSNLFDAIRFLHLLTAHTINDAAQKIRETSGRSLTPASLFTAFGDYREPEMRFTAELIIRRDVQDDFGVPVEAATSAVEYEVAFRQSEDDTGRRLQLTYESLKAIPAMTVPKRIGFPASKEFIQSCRFGRRSVPLISTGGTEVNRQITLHQEGHGGRKLPADNPLRTVVGSTNTAEFPTVLAVRREFESWRTLMLEPSAMRAPSERNGPDRIDVHGANLPAAIRRMERRAEKNESQRGQVCARIAGRLGELLDDVRGLSVEDDAKTETYTLIARGRDDVSHPARSLSDGTLWFLVLAALEQDPEATGVICLEEPENGIHPDRIRAMVKLLHDIAVDAEEPIEADNPLRQVIVNTHSPLIVKELSHDDIVYIDEARANRRGSSGRVANALVPPHSWRARHPDHPAKVAESRLIAYLGESAGDWLNMNCAAGEARNAI